MNSFKDLSNVFSYIFLCQRFPVELHFALLVVQLLLKSSGVHFEYQVGIDHEDQRRSGKCKKDFREKKKEKKRFFFFPFLFSFSSNFDNCNTRATGVRKHLDILIKPKRNGELLETVKAKGWSFLSKEHRTQLCHMATKIQQTTSTTLANAIKIWLPQL